MARRPTMADERNETEMLQAYLRELHLPTFRASFEEVARRAQQEGLSYERFLLALAQELVRSGRKVLFTTCNLLVQELLIAKRDLKLSRVLKRLAGFGVLVIDDLGYVQQSREEMEVLFTLLAERYERGSVMLTSNLPFSGWEAIFKDPMTTAAAIDRLVHHSVIVELNVPSYRLETAKDAKKPTANQAEPPTTR